MSGFNNALADNYSETMHSLKYYQSLNDVQPNIPQFYFQIKGGSSFVGVRGIQATIDTFNNIPTNSLLNITNQNNTAKSYGAALGYMWYKQDTPLRTEVEFYARSNLNYNQPMLFQSQFASAGIPDQSIASSIKNRTVFFNAYWDFNGEESTMRPFLGFGVGNCRNTTSTTLTVNNPGLSGSGTTTNSTNSFGFNISAGIGFWVSQHFSISASYRWVNLGRVQWGANSYLVNGFAPANRTTQLQASPYTSQDFMFGLMFAL